MASHMGHTADKHRATVVTVWLVLTILYNGAGALKGVMGFGATLWARHYVVTGATDKALEERELTRAQAESAIANTLAWSFSYSVLRGATAGFVVWLLFWKKLAFWCYAGSTCLLFAVNLWGGDSIWEANIDLIGLGVVTGLVHLVEPTAWSQLE